MGQKELVGGIRKKYQALRRVLDERQRRLWAGAGRRPNVIPPGIDPFRVGQGRDPVPVQLYWMGHCAILTRAVFRVYRCSYS